MKGFIARMRGRWRSALIIALLTSAIGMVAILALQAVYAWSFHRRVAESVLRDYSRVVAEEFIRRTSADIGYRAYFWTITAISRPMIGSPDPALPGIETLEGPADGRVRPVRELVRSLYLYDPETGDLTTEGAPIDDAAREQLVASFESALAKSGSSREPFTVLQWGGPSGQRSFIHTLVAPPPGRAPWIAGFEADLGAMGPWLARAMDRGPLLPKSLGDGEMTNDLLSIRLDDSEGRMLFSAGGETDPTLATSTPFGDTYSGMFEGMTLIASVHPEAAPRLVIGGLPRSNLPVLLTMLALTVGLLVAAMHQFRRERALARMRAEFVSRVSHELRTPLTQIRIFAETLLLGRARTAEESRRSLEIVDQEARRLGNLVENILQFSRGERGGVRLALRPVSVEPLLHDVAEKFRPLARAKRVSLAVEGAAEIICLADEDALRQILLNLLDNAVKYGPAGQEIRIGMEAAAGRVRIRVDDAGPGVPERDRERIWRRWQRLERDERAAVAGTGIGLTVVRDLVGLQGGRAWVETGPRGGARFLVELPLAGGGAAARGAGGEAVGDAAERAAGEISGAVRSPVDPAAGEGRS